MIAEGSVVEGNGQIIRKDGTVIDITLKSDPLTKEQAEALNQEGQDNGSNSR